MTELDEAALFDRQADVDLPDPAAVEAVGARRRYRPYPEYRDSGVERIGDVPAHWIVKALKRDILVSRGASLCTDDDVDFHK